MEGETFILEWEAEEERGHCEERKIIVGLKAEEATFCSRGSLVVKMNQQSLLDYRMIWSRLKEGVGEADHVEGILGLLGLELAWRSVEDVVLMGRTVL